MDVGLTNNPEMKSEKNKTQSVYLNNSDLFSTLSRNYDILPEEFQEILQCKEINKNGDNPNNFLISKEKADLGLKSRNFRI